ncbi:MAG TPA: hypothetical protein VN944_02760 [Nitrospiria bacterium]|nr:hypothetical protein [Nitrospiria bacterium]
MSQVKKWLFCVVLGVLIIMPVLVLTRPAEAHVKGVTLSQYGMIDMSLNINLMYANMTNYAEGYNQDVVGSSIPRGFTLKSADLSLSAELFQFPAKFALFITNNEYGSSIEETFVYFHKMPFNTSLKAGIFRSNFGKLNPVHDHEWNFATPPIITNIMLGEDGIHKLGMEVTWQPPIETFVEFSLDVQNAQLQQDFGNANRFASFVRPADPLHYGGDSAGTDTNRFIIIPKVSSVLGINDATTWEPGISMAIGNNKNTAMIAAAGCATTCSQDDKTVLIDLESTLFWKPPTSPIFPNVRWTVEGIMAQRDNPIINQKNLTPAGYGMFMPVDFTQPPLSRGAVAGKSDTVWGLYTEASYRYAYRHELAARFDYVAPSSEDYIDPASSQVVGKQEDSHVRYTAAYRYYVSPVARWTFEYDHLNASGLQQDSDIFIVQLNMGLGTVTPGVGKFLTLF